MSIQGFKIKDLTEKNKGTKNVSVNATCST